MFLSITRIWRDTRGQDLIEYVLMSGLLAMTAAATLPGLSYSISRILAVVGSVLVTAQSQGS
jgi:Flp pilus assembly pilin Flp